MWGWREAEPSKQVSETTCCIAWLLIILTTRWQLNISVLQHVNEWIINKLTYSTQLPDLNLCTGKTFGWTTSDMFWVWGYYHLSLCQCHRIFVLQLMQWYSFDVMCFPDPTVNGVGGGFLYILQVSCVQSKTVFILMIRIYCVGIFTNICYRISITHFHNAL